MRFSSVFPQHFFESYHVELARFSDTREGRPLVPLLVPKLLRGLAQREGGVVVAVLLVVVAVLHFAVAHT